MNILHWRLTKFDKKNWSSSPRRAYACIPPAYSSRLFNSWQDDIQFVYAWCSYGIERRSNMANIITTGCEEKKVVGATFQDPSLIARVRYFPSEPVVPPLVAFEHSYLNISLETTNTPRKRILMNSYGCFQYIDWDMSAYCVIREEQVPEWINYVYCHGTKALSQLLNNYCNDSSVCQFKPVLFNF